MSSSPRRRVHCHAVWIAGAVLGGCTLGPDFKRPDPPSIDHYDQASVALPAAGVGQTVQTLRPGAPPAAEWWQAFECAALDETVDLALLGNPTLAAAQATLAAAEETLTATRGAYYPQADLNSALSRGNSGGMRQAGIAAGNYYSIGATVSYSIDLFGGIRRRVEQQAALADYQRGLTGAAYLLLTGNVVTTAISVAGAAEQITAVNEIISADAKNLQLVQVSMTAGKSAGTDVLAAEGQLANDRALLPPLRQQLDAARHALAILAGQFPAEWAAPEFRFENLKLPGDLPLTLPSELVRSRPDILAAEAQLHAASAAVGIATAGLFPSLTLSGNWTSAAPGTAALFTPASDLWSAAAGATAPLFHGGNLRAERRAAMHTLDAQRALYRQTVLQAFGQVADALKALQHDAEAVDAEQAALEASRASLELTQQSYEAGQSSLVQILEAQRLYQQARLGMARAVSARYLDTALFFLALGGDATR